MQVSVFSSAERHADYCRGVSDSLLREGIRSDVDADNEKIVYQISKAGMVKRPYMWIIGDKETENNTVNIRKRNGESIAEMTIEELIVFLRDEIINRR